METPDEEDDAEDDTQQDAAAVRGRVPYLFPFRVAYHFGLWWWLRARSYEEKCEKQKKFVIFYRYRHLYGKKCVNLQQFWGR